MLTFVLGSSTLSMTHKLFGRCTGPLESARHGQESMHEQASQYLTMLPPLAIAVKDDYSGAI